MLNPRTLKPGALFWIRADITGNGEVWQRAILRQSDEGPMIRYLDSDSGEFEDYWDPTDEDPANFRMDAPEAPDTPDVRVLREQIAELKNRNRAANEIIYRWKIWWDAHGDDQHLPVYRETLRYMFERSRAIARGFVSLPNTELRNAGGGDRLETLTCNENMNTTENAAPTGVPPQAPGSAKLRYVLPPECSDGQHSSIVDTKEDVLAAVAQWCAEAVEGESLTIGTRMMTDAEVNALPPI